MCAVGDLSVLRKLFNFISWPMVGLLHVHTPTGWSVTLAQSFPYDEDKIHSLNCLSWSTFLMFLISIFQHQNILRNLSLYTLPHFPVNSTYSLNFICAKWNYLVFYFKVGQKETRKPQWFILKIISERLFSY